MVKTTFKTDHSWIDMGFQHIPVWGLNGSDPYQTFSSILKPILSLRNVLFDTGCNDLIDIVFA